MKGATAVAATLLFGTLVAQAQEKPALRNFPELAGLNYTGSYEIGKTTIQASLLFEGAGEGGMKAKIASYPRSARYCVSDSYVGRQVPATDAGVLLQFEVSLPGKADCGGMMKFTTVSDKELSGAYMLGLCGNEGCKMKLTR